MPDIIRDNEQVETKQLSVKIKASVVDELLGFCSLKKYKSPASVVEQAIEFILSKDEKWKNTSADQKAKLIRQAKTRRVKIAAVGA